MRSYLRTKNQPPEGYLATYLLEAGYDTRTFKELLGHKDVSTAMLFTSMS